MKTIRPYLPIFKGLIIILALAPCAAMARDSSTQLEACIRRAETHPDQSRLESDVWLKKGGGQSAKLCKAYAHYYAREDELAGDLFSSLSRERETLSPNTHKNQTAKLYALSGESYHRAKLYAKAEKSYTRAIKLEPQSPELWHERARAKAAQEKFWEAIDDLNKALEIMPDDPDILRTRGQVWIKCGQDTNAKADFLKAADQESYDSPSPKPSLTQ